MGRKNRRKKSGKNKIFDFFIKKIPQDSFKNPARIVQKSCEILSKSCENPAGNKAGKKSFSVHCRAVKAKIRALFLTKSFTFPFFPNSVRQNPPKICQIFPNFAARVAYYPVT